ncbi:hypothetical protein IT575_11465 [bacterium]|nr:hypothetical protein [bacterium]
MYGGILRCRRQLVCALLRAIAVLLLLALCACGGPGPQEAAPDPGTSPDPAPILPDHAEQPGITADLISSASYDRSSRRVSVQLDAGRSEALELELDVPAGINSLGGSHFELPAGRGRIESELVFSELGARSSQLRLSARRAGSAESESLLLNIPHPRLELSASYDPASHVLTVSAAHPYREAVQLALQPSLGVGIDGPLAYSFSTGIGTRAFGVRFDNPQISSGRVSLDFSAPRCEPLHLEVNVSLSRIITETRWLLPENILRVSLDNGYSGAAELPLSLDCDCPPGISVIGPRSQTLPGSSGSLDFRFAFAEGELPDYTVHLKASDAQGHSDAADVALTRLPPAIPDGALQVYPLASHVAAGQPLRFVVASGRTRFPLLFLANVTLAFHPGASYVENSFNIGAPGGAAEAPDGLWAACAPADGFLTVVDQTYAQASKLVDGRKMLSFNITPLLGQPVAGGGELFSFELRFSQPGSYSIELIDRKWLGVQQTYYFNMNQPLLLWEDSSGRHPGVPYEVTVY